ncbi:MAG: CopD family protein [Sciscionella sp.]|nr:CopD family protein [Sciscionella sp.]
MAEHRATSGLLAARPYLIAIGLLVAALAGVVVGLALTAGPTPTSTGLVRPPAAVEYGLPVARALLDLAALTTIGLSLLPMVIGVDTARGTAAERVLTGTRSAAVLSSVAVLSSAVWAVAAGVSLALQTVDWNPAAPLTFGLIATFASTVGVGQALAIVTVAAGVQTVVWLLAVRGGQRVRAEPRLLLAVFTVLPLPATGHAGDATSALHGIAMVSIQLHVIAAMCWTGGLLAVCVTVAAQRSLLASALPRFSKLATVCLLTVAGTGVLNGLVQLSSVPGVHWYTALLATGYGWLVIGKVLCAGALAAIGGGIRMRLLPLIVKHRSTGLLGWAAVELAVMGLAYGLAAVLTRTPVVR